MKNKHLGFTLIELLISMAILAIILAVLVSFFSQNSQASMQMGARADMQQDILSAQQLITGRLREAYYVLPPGQTVVLSSQDNAKDIPTYSNPTPTRYRKSTWWVGSDPILAMILPPADGTAGQNCTLASTAAATTAGNNACYRFYAYYPINRKVWTDGTNGSNDPGTDAPNGNAWVLVQYMGYLINTFYNDQVSSAGVSVPNVASYLNYKGASAQILTDYLEPTINDSTTAGLTNDNTTYTMFNYANSQGTVTATNLATPANPVTAVTVNLAAARLVGSKLIRLPDATNEYSITVNLTNQGKVAVQ